MLTLAIFAVALLVRAPAQSVTRLVSLPPQVVALQGRLGRGRAVLAGGLTVDWRLTVAPRRLALAAPLEIAGPGTAAAARVLAGPGGLALEGGEGRIGPEVLALVEADGLRCTMAARLRGVVLSRRWSGASAAGGEIALPAGRCSNRVAQDVALPALRVLLGGADGTATAEVTGDGAQLGSVALGPDRLDLRLEPDGARLIPGLPSGAASTLSLPLGG